MCLAGFSIWLLPPDGVSDGCCPLGRTYLHGSLSLSIPLLFRRDLFCCLCFLFATVDLGQQIPTLFVQGVPKPSNASCGQLLIRLRPTAQLICFDALSACDLDMIACLSVCHVELPLLGEVVLPAVDVDRRSTSRSASSMAPTACRIPSVAS